MPRAAIRLKLKCRIVCCLRAPPDPITSGDRPDTRVSGPPSCQVTMAGVTSRYETPPTTLVYV